MRNACAVHVSEPFVARREAALAFHVRAPPHVGITNVQTDSLQKVFIVHAPPMSHLFVGFSARNASLMKPGNGCGGGGGEYWAWTVLIAPKVALKTDAFFSLL